MDILLSNPITNVQRYYYIALLTNDDGSFKKLLLATWNKNRIDSYITNYICENNEIPTLLISDCQRSNTIAASIFLLTMYNDLITYKTALVCSNKFWLVNVGCYYAPNVFDIQAVHDPIRFKYIPRAERMFGPFSIESKLC
jgi:hypothetical protein